MSSHTNLRALIVSLPVIGLMAIVSIVMSALIVTKPAHAQTVSPGVCRTAIVFDRSGSVTAADMNVLREQTKRLFQPGGLNDAKIELAFWSFSSEFVWNANTNFNTPFNDYVSSKGPNAGFNTSLARISSGGSTNYEQGLAYNNGVRNGALKSIIDRADIIVFLTDGQPNADSASARRNAALAHYKDGREILGGLIGTATGATAEMLNGNSRDNTNIFPISKNYDDLSIKLRDQIGAKCRVLDPVEPCPYNADLPLEDPRCVPPIPKPYSLAPTVSGNNRVITGNDNANFIYKVDNNSTETTSGDTSWSVKQVIVDRGKSVDPLTFAGTPPYRDGVTCATLVGLIPGSVCNDNYATGTRKFTPGTTTLTAAELGAASTVVIDDKYPVGTKLCYVFSIAKPTENATPINRASSAACVVVGKRPTVQIHGGDLTVGRRFKGEPVVAGAPLSGVVTSTTAKGGTINKSFGSWAEYGVFAPGVVRNFASASGLEGGVATSGNPDPQMNWSKLTFANIGGYGNFTGADGLGQMQDTTGYFLQGRPVIRDFNGTNDHLAINGADFQSGVYQKTNGNLIIDGSTLEPGKTVIVSVPNGDVTITGNLSYNGGPYQSVGQIPQLVIMAKNITIAASVTNVDAWLIASPTAGAGGVLSTCDVTTTLTSEVCNSPLRVNGPTVAKQLLLKRTGGAGTGANSGDPAEVFNLRADTYLWAHNEGRSEVRATTTWTIELPPYY